MNRGEELGDGPAPLADFGHGSLFEGAPGPRRFCATAELSRRSHFMPIEICMESDGLHAYFDRRQVIRSRAAAGSAKPPTRKRSEKSALMASVWGKLWTPYCHCQLSASVVGSKPPGLCEQFRPQRRIGLGNGPSFNRKCPGAFCNGGIALATKQKPESYLVWYSDANSGSRDGTVDARTRQ